MYNRICKWLLAFILLVLALVCFTSASLADKNGWEMENYHLYYYESDVKLTGTQTIDGVIYYFANDGALKGNGKAQNTGYGIVYPDNTNVLQTGWITLATGKYYFDPTTAKAAVPYHNDPPIVNNVRYLFNDDGILVVNGWWTRWSYIGPSHHSNENGVVMTGYHKIDGYYYLFEDVKGESLKGFQTVNGQIHYFSPSMNNPSEGYPEARGWKKIDSYWYYFNPNSGVLNNASLDLDGYHYSFTADGHLIINSPMMIIIDNKISALGTDGNELQGWQTIDNATYYFGSDYDHRETTYVALTGMRYLKDQDSTKYNYYYFDEAGKLQRNFLIKLEDGLYFFDSDGKRVQGWKLLDGKRYYFKPAALIGMHSLTDYDSSDMHKYLFDSNGIMQSKLLYTDPESENIYYFGSDGKSTAGWLTLGKDTYCFRHYSFDAYRNCTQYLERNGEYKYFIFGSDGRLIGETDDPYADPSSIEVDGNVYDLDTEKKTAVLRSVQNKATTKLTIPAVVITNSHEYKVIKIGTGACSDLTELGSVSIGKNVKLIDKKAFANDKKLTKVSGGKAVETIGDSAFESCIMLPSVPAFSKLTTIGNNAFQKCAALTSFTIGKNVTKIGKNAFNGCKKLAKITIKTAKLTKKTIGKNCFKGIAAKAVFKCPKKQKKDYETWLKKPGGAPKTAKFK